MTRDVGAGVARELETWVARHRPGDPARVLVLTGPAGAGKTYAATEALATCAAAGMLTGAGKFAEGQVGAAFGPVMTALSTTVAAAMRTLFDRQTGVASLVDALGVQLDVLVAAGFEVADVPAGRTIAALANRRGSATRITAAVLALLDWLTRFGTPRVLLIDDWYRAGSEVRQLLAAVAAAPAATALTLLLTQREAEPVPLSAAQGIDRVIAVDALTAEETRALLAARLGEPAGELAATALADAGVAPLPFDVLLAADALIEQRVLRQGRTGWEIDEARFRSLALDASARVASLEEPVFRVALALALWGDRAPLADFRHAAGDPAAVDSALAVLAAREIVAVRAGSVVFRHDRLRVGTRARADEATARVVAGSVAEALLGAGARGEAATAALHLRLLAGIGEAAPAAWRDAFANGATAARNRGDAAAADAFAEAALALHDRAPATERGAARLILREALIAAANRNDPVTEDRARALIATARTRTELYADYEVGIVGLRLADAPERAWVLASEGLRRAGLRPPPRRPGLRTILAALRWKLIPWPVNGFEPGAEADAFTGMAAAAAHLAYHRDPRGTAIIAFDASRRSGPTFQRTPYWASVDCFLHAATGNRRAAARSAEHAVTHAAEQAVYRAATIYQATFFGLHWCHPLAEQRARYLEIAEIAQLEGDLVTAAYAWRMHVMVGWRAGVPLPQLCDEGAVAARALRDLGEDAFSAEIDAMNALLRGLAGGAEWDPNAWRFDIDSRNHVIDLELSNLAGDWAETVRRAERLLPLWDDYAIQSDSVVLAFHETLARLRCGRRPRRAAVRRLREGAELNPADHAGKLRLIEAELKRVAGAGAAVQREAYERAGAAAAASSSRLDAGLTHVCAAEALRAVGETEAAERHRAAAELAWRAWGLRQSLHLQPASVPTRDQLAEAEARAAAAERADAAKSRLLAHVGHELRTPLQALQAALDLSVQTREPVDMADVRLVLGSLTRLVDDLDVIGGLADVRAGGTVAEVDLAELVRSEIALLRGAEVVLAVEGGGLVRVAADRVRQIVRNLLSNAIKYGGGTVEVTLSIEPAGGTMRAELMIADRGPGVPPVLHAAIFTAFERGERVGDGRGVGLGLALSRQLAERLGGTLTVADRAGGGACFTLRLTLPAAETGIAEPSRAPPTVCRDIVLIEDSPAVRRLLATVLGQLGYAVREAGTAAAGLAAWRAARPDLVIVDLGLPDASGLEVLAAVRADDPEARVILLSAAITEPVAATIAADPRTRALRKPASAQSLQAAIAELFGTVAAAPDSDLDADPLFAAARVEVSAQARAVVADRAAASPQALHKLAGTAAQFGWAPVADAVDAFAAALARDEGVEPAGAEVIAALELMR